MATESKYNPKKQLQLTAASNHILPFRPSSGLIDLQALWQAYLVEINHHNDPKFQLNDDEWVEFHNDLRTLTSDQKVAYPKDYVAPNIPLVKFDGSNDADTPKPAIPFKYLPCYLELFPHIFYALKYETADRDEAVPKEKPAAPIKFVVAKPHDGRKTQRPPTLDDLVNTKILQSTLDFFGQTPEETTSETSETSDAEASDAESDCTDDEDIDYLPPSWSRSYIVAPKWFEIAPYPLTNDLRYIDVYRLGIRVCELLGRFDDAQQVAKALDFKLHNHPVVT